VTERLPVSQNNTFPWSWIRRSPAIYVDACHVILRRIKMGVMCGTRGGARLPSELQQRRCRQNSGFGNTGRASFVIVLSVTSKCVRLGDDGLCIGSTDHRYITINKLCSLCPSISRRFTDKTTHHFFDGPPIAVKHPYTANIISMCPNLPPPAQLSSRK
jgi:hypothetical protein